MATFSTHISERHPQLVTEHTCYVVTGFFLDSDHLFTQEVHSEEALWQFLARIENVKGVQIQSITQHLELSPHACSAD